MRFLILNCFLQVLQWTAVLFDRFSLGLCGASDSSLGEQLDKNKVKLQAMQYPSFDLLYVLTSGDSQPTSGYVSWLVTG